MFLSENKYTKKKYSDFVGDVILLTVSKLSFFQSSLLHPWPEKPVLVALTAMNSPITFVLWAL